jgi:hypothetical protein
MTATPLADNTAAEMTVKEAREILRHPVFGDPVHLHAVSILSAFEELDALRDELWDDTFECSKCEGAGHRECPECGTRVRCQECGGSGVFRGLEALERSLMREPNLNWTMKRITEWTKTLREFD